MKRCQRFVSQLDRFIENDFSEEERIELMAHLGECESCQAEFEAMNNLIALLEDIPLMDVPEAFKESVMGKIRKDE